MLRRDPWEQSTGCYLEALDEIARRTKAGSNRFGRSSDGYRLCERTAALAEWHHLSLDRFFGSEAEDSLDRLARHPALAGPELLSFRA